MFKITAKQYGNSVTYIDDANVDPKQALVDAIKRANDIFDVKSNDPKPTVSVVEIEDKG